MDVTNALRLALTSVSGCSVANLCRYGAGKVSSGANVDGAPLPEDVEENGKEEEVGEFGFHTLVGPSNCLACSNTIVHLPVKPMPYPPLLYLAKTCMGSLSANMAATGYT